MNKNVTGAEISHPISANATTQLRENGYVGRCLT